MSSLSIVKSTILRLCGFTFGAASMLYIAANLLLKGRKAFHVKDRPIPPKLLTDPIYGTHKFAYLPKQGIKLHYVEKGNRVNPLLLCIHGFPECWFSYKNILTELSKDYWVIAVNLRGYAESSKPVKIKDYEFDVLVEDVREFISHFKKQKCYLIAHDWGGVIGWDLVTRYPELFVKHVSINGPHLSAYEERVNSSFSQFRKSWYIGFFQLPYLPELLLSMNDMKNFNLCFRKHDGLPGLSDEELEVYKYYFAQKNGFTPAINYYRNVLSIKKEHVKKCLVDSLIVWGENDVFLDRELAEYTKKYCNKVQINYIKNCGHFVLQDCPSEAIDSIKQFFESK